MLSVVVADSVARALHGLVFGAGQLDAPRRLLACAIAGASATSDRGLHEVSCGWRASTLLDGACLIRVSPADRQLAAIEQFLIK